MRILGDILRDVLDGSDRAPIQILHECMLGARSVKAKRRSPAYTRVEFATTNLTPDDLMWFSGDLGRPDSRKPKYIGIVVWVPTQDYEKPETLDAVDDLVGGEGQKGATRDE